jgi:small subunit ribosomal protein S7
MDSRVKLDKQNNNGNNQGVLNGLDLIGNENEFISSMDINYKKLVSYERIRLKLINQLMRDGKKTKAEMIFNKSLAYIKKNSGYDPKYIIIQAVFNGRPFLGIKNRRFGGVIRQIPFALNIRHQLALSIRWIVYHSRKRGESSMVQRISNEILDTFNNKGQTIFKKDQLHKQAEANRAFAHYRW